MYNVRLSGLNNTTKLRFLFGEKVREGKLKRPTADQLNLALPLHHNPMFLKDYTPVARVVWALWQRLHAST